MKCKTSINTCDHISFFSYLWLNGEKHLFTDLWNSINKDTHITIYGSKENMHEGRKSLSISSPICCWKIPLVFHWMKVQFPWQPVFWTDCLYLSVLQLAVKVKVWYSYKMRTNLLRSDFTICRWFLLDTTEKMLANWEKGGSSIQDHRKLLNLRLFLK